jgi:hypothetical protein
MGKPLRIQRTGVARRIEVSGEHDIGTLAVQGPHAHGANSAVIGPEMNGKESEKRTPSRKRCCDAGNDDGTGQHPQEGNDGLLR